MRLILVRHGQTAFNRDRRVQGLSDICLTDAGERQARAVARRLQAEGLDAIYCSPLERALATARLIAETHDLPINVEEGLQEMDIGEMEGLTGAEMRSQYPELLRRWGTDPASVRMPGGETLGELQQRAWTAVEGMLGRHRDQTVVAVSHNFAIQTIICRALGLSLANFHRLRLDLCGVSILEFGRRGPALVTYNDTCHLAESE